MSITTEAKKEVEHLLQQGQQSKAIQYLCNTFGISLPEAQRLVEAAKREAEANLSTANTLTGQSSTTSLDGHLKEEVIKLLKENKKIEAVKRVKAALNTGLKEALKQVEAVDKETNPNYRSVNIGCFSGMFKIIALFFGFIGLVFLCIAGIIYYFQSKTIDNSEKVTGVVVDMRTSTDGTAAPVIAYQWKSKEKRYYSNTYSNPPACEINEEVLLFVNRDDPSDVVPDTFSDRWFLIAVFGGLGTVFILFTGLFMFIGQKF